MAKILHSKIQISLELAILKVIQFEMVTLISRSINPDFFVDRFAYIAEKQQIQPLSLEFAV